MSLVEKPRNYKKEYKKFQSSPSQIKKRTELNRINHEKGTYGNGDNLDVSHVNGGVKLEPESTNRGRKEKSRMNGSKRKMENGGKTPRPRELKKADKKIKAAKKLAERHHQSGGLEFKPRIVKEDGKVKAVDDSTIQQIVRKTQRAKAIREDFWKKQEADRGGGYKKKMANGGPLTEKQLAKLTDKQRAVYNKAMANRDKNIKKTEAGGFKKPAPNVKYKTITSKPYRKITTGSGAGKTFQTKEDYEKYVSSGQREKDRDVYKKKGKEEIQKASNELKNRKKPKVEVPEATFKHDLVDFKGKVIEKGSDSKNKVPEATFKDGLRDVHGKLIENPDGTKTDYYKETYMKKTKPVKKKVKEKLDPMGTSGETEKQYQARLKKERTEKLTSFKPANLKAKDVKYKPTKVQTKKVKPASKADRYVAEMTKRGKMGKVRKSLKTRVSEAGKKVKSMLKGKPLTETQELQKKYREKKFREKHGKDAIGGWFKQEGGMLEGPSHAKGGIAAKVGKQPIEMEGGEYVIKKSSAKKLGEDVLDYLNETGKVPQFMAGGYAKKMYMDGGMVEGEALEMGGKVQDNRAGFTPVYEQGGKVTVSSEAGAGDIAHTHTHSGYKAGE